jgi:predicted nucleic acid-binding protein
MPLVVDASVGLAWVLPDESSAYADAVLAAVERDGLRVPELWTREIANGLAVAYLRKRITPADEQAFLTALSHLSIDVEEINSAVAVIREGTAAAMRYLGQGPSVGRSMCTKRRLGDCLQMMVTARKIVEGRVG